MFDASNHQMILIGKAKPVTLATEYIKSMTGMKGKTPRSSRESDTQRTGTPKMIFIMESRKSPDAQSGDGKDFGEETQALLQMNEVQNAAINASNLDTLGSVMETNDREDIGEDHDTLTERNVDQLSRLTADQGTTGEGWTTIIVQAQIYLDTHLSVKPDFLLYRNAARH